MTLPLTSDQLNDLGALASAADDSPSDGSLRASYYQYLAAAGDPYGALASGVADGSTLTGLVARYFLADEGYALHGVTISADLMNQISVTLMNDDYADRLQSQGAALDYGQIKDRQSIRCAAVRVGQLLEHRFQGHLSRRGGLLRRGGGFPGGSLLRGGWFSGHQMQTLPRGWSCDASHGTRPAVKRF